MNEYQELCKHTAIKFEDKEKEILTWALGIAGEAGDVASCIKKTICHKKDEIAGIKENIGDTMWYIAMICNYYNWDMDTIIKENIEKLKKRFPQGWDFEKAKRESIDWNKDEVKK
jgi:NTP pyrophosphatase (non-canonical NTP hydrolase)